MTENLTLFEDAPRSRIESPKFDVTAGRHGGNPESAAAHARIAGSKAESRERVLAFAVSRGDRGVTTDEVAEHFGVAPNVVSGRLTELKALGKLIATGRRRKTRSGCSAMVLIAAQVRR